MLSVGNASIFPAHFGGLSAALAGLPVAAGPAAVAAAAAAAAAAHGHLIPSAEMNSPSPDMFTAIRYILLTISSLTSS